MPIHMSLDSDFNHLINDQYGKNDEQSDLSFRE